MKIGLFYGSTTGNTENAADLIAKKFGDGLVAESIDRVSKNDLESFDVLIFGISTWNIGQLEMTWEDFFPELDEIDFTGKKVALFGLGDQSNYSDTFLDALGILYNKLIERGADVFGFWPITGYSFDTSLAVQNGKFVGLALDEDNQREKTEERIDQWVKELKETMISNPLELET